MKKRLTLRNIQLWCVFDDCFTWIFACNLEWKSVKPSQEEVNEKGIRPSQVDKVQMTTVAPKLCKSAQYLGKLHLEITLKTIRPAGQHPSALPNEHYLSKAAFQPRVFTIFLEKGYFIPDRYIGCNDVEQWALRFQSDAPIFPTGDAWVTREQNPRAYGPLPLPFVDQTTTFVARRLRRSQSKIWAMNEPAFADGDYLKPIRKWLFGMDEGNHICGTCTPIFGPGPPSKAMIARQRNCPNR